MKIGYPCINRSIGCSASKTFRLSSYTEKRFVETVENNLDSLKKILEWNVEKGILFFRISSDTIPFASHPVCTYNWQKYFKDQFSEVGNFIKENNIRTSMHPDQFVLINSLSEDVFQRSMAELKYHAEMFDLMKLDLTHKIQIHVGGVYGDKDASMQRFIERFQLLPETIKSRLVIENDDRLYSLKDCLYIYEKTQIPILFDTFHHFLNNNGESLKEAFQLAFSTWKNKDSVPMIDYSSQEIGLRTGSHSYTIDENDFRKFIKNSKDFDFDIMLEIKDKEISAEKALQISNEKKI